MKRPAAWCAGLVIAVAAIAAPGCGNKDDSGKTGTAEPPPPKPPEQPTPPPPPRAELDKDSGAKGEAKWVFTAGGPGRDEPRGVALTADGGAVVTGIFSKTIKMGTGEMDAKALDVFVAKLDDKGKLDWATALGSGAEDIAADIAVDRDGNVVVVGWFGGPMKVGTTILKAEGSDDVFVVKLDPNGKPLWARSFGGPNTDGASAVAIDPGGDIVVVGMFRGTVNFGGKPLESQGNDDIFILRLDADGAHKWSKSFGDLGEDYGRSVVIDSRGDIVMGAEFTAEVDFGGGKPLKHVGNRDAALVKLGSDGSYKWARSYGNTFVDWLYEVAVDKADNIVVGGSFEDKLKLGGEEHIAKGRRDALVAKFSAEGKPLWSVSFGDDRDDETITVGSDNFGNVVAGGWFVGKVETTVGDLKAPSANQDAFMVKLSHDGQWIWAKQFGDHDHDRSRALVVAPDGTITLAGLFRFTLDVGNETRESVHKAKDKIAPADIFVARFEK